MCFRRKHAPDLRAKDRDLIDKMDKTFGAIISTTTEDDVIDALKTTQGSVRYLVPSTNKKVIALDEKLNNQIDDLRVEAFKGKTNSEKILSTLKEINISISLRNSRG